MMITAPTANDPNMELARIVQPNKKSNQGKAAVSMETEAKVELKTKQVVVGAVDARPTSIAFFMMTLEILSASFFTFHKTGWSHTTGVAPF